MSNPNYQLKQMERVKIFYHFYACRPEYKLWLDEQLGAIRDCGLSQLGKVRMTVVFEESVNPDEFSNYIESNYMDVVETVKEVPHEEYRYHEGSTLDEVYQFSRIYSRYKILYLHSKGISKTSCPEGEQFDAVDFPSPFIANMRRKLQKHVITEYQACLDQLNQYEVSGPYLRMWPVPFFRGNFWWANSEYIEKLQPPLSDERFDTEIVWGSVSKYAADRIASLPKPIPVYKKWGTTANEFWVCNNTVHSNGFVTSRFPKMDIEILRKNFKQLQNPL